MNIGEFLHVVQRRCHETTAGEDVALENKGKLDFFFPDKQTLSFKRPHQKKKKKKPWMVLKEAGG